MYVYNMYKKPKGQGFLSICKNSLVEKKKAKNL